MRSLVRVPSLALFRAALLFLVAVTVPACGGGAARCAPGELRCGGVCTKVLTDPLQCGACGAPCGDGFRCNGGVCQALACTTPAVPCGNRCVDTSTDTAHCGRCDNTCPAGQLCTAGACVGDCPAGDLVCANGGGDACVDDAASVDHCGGCGNACAADQTCNAGTCACAPGLAPCSGACVDTGSDPRHCGGCGLPCGADEVCVASQCVCRFDRAPCSGACVLTALDEAHCGACGVPCGIGTICSDGICQAECNGDRALAYCGGNCVDPRVDPTNCGGCGVVCGPGSECVASSCKPVNDALADATLLTLPSVGTELSVTGTTVLATRDPLTVGGAPLGVCFQGPAVFYRFSVTERTLVYFDTIGSQPDTALALVGSDLAVLGGAANAALSDDALCGTTPEERWQAQLAAVVPSGTHYLVVSGCSSGPFTLHVQRLELPAGVDADHGAAGDGRVYPRLGARANEDFIVGAGTRAAAVGCAGASSVVQDAVWFTACGSEEVVFSVCPSDSGSWSRGAGDNDPVLAFASGGSRTTSCVDDALDCPARDGDFADLGARVTSGPLARGVHRVYVDNRASDALAGTLSYVRTR